MASKHKEIARREFLAMGTKNTAGVIALTTLASCTTSEELSTDENPIIGDNEKEQKVTIYEVDPAWPQKPEEFTWGGIPGVDVDVQGRVWLINRALPLVQSYDADGTFLTAMGNQGVDVVSIAGGPVDLTFSSPNPRIHQMKVDYEGNVWIATWGLGVVYKCSPEGKVLLVLGTFNENGVDETHFGEPNDMEITPTGEVFVADGERNFRIVHFDPDGKFIKAWGKQGTGPGEFEVPHAIVIDSKGLIYVADRGNTRVQVFDQSGNFIDQWPNIVVPFDLWVDSEDNIWVCGYGPLRTKSDYHLPKTEDQLVMKFNPQGKVLLNWTFTWGENPGELGELHGMALDSKGNVYLGDVRGNRIQKFALQE
ncbi:peptidyl-alpha-hydroxyglycine alpha-amidating lyase family protein [Candidatus Latescibacterota bacterium]